MVWAASYVSVADDASSIYWNPAGIASLNQTEVQSFYTPWLVETNFYYNSAVIPMGVYGSIGLSFTSITMDEMMVRTVQDPEPNEYGQKFDAGNISMGIAYAKRLTDRFSFRVPNKIHSGIYLANESSGLCCRYWNNVCNQKQFKYRNEYF